MINLFERLPGLIVHVASWALGNPMTCLLISTFALGGAFIGLTATYQSRTRRDDQRRAQHRSKPGSFPGDNR